MNKIFNIIWSKTKERWIVVSEKVKTNGGVPKSKLLSLALLMALFAGGERAYALDPSALPTGGQVTQGSATFTTSGSRMTVNQSTQQMVANWESFNIGANAGVRFNQPNSSSAALNRINGQNPTQIMGSLSANGRVFLLNPSGIIFGSTSRVDVGSLVASSLNMLDSDFLAGRYTLKNSGSAGSVVNQGLITAMPGGVVAMIAPKVSNEGTITANGGSVALAAGNQVSVDFQGDGLITLTVDEGVVEALADNKGIIKGDGGVVIMTAKSADALVKSAVNNSGIIEAKSLQMRDSRIVLDAEGGMTTVSGTLDASSAAGRGGSIIVTGERVLVQDGAHLTASGATSGGDVLVGGSWQNSDTSVRQATGTIVEPGALLEANATESGNGGTVVAWSDISNSSSVTLMDGAIKTLGAGAGIGGNVETSGHQLGVGGSVDAGNGGNWLLDPINITVTSSGGTVPAGGGSYSTAGNVIASTINTALSANNNVTLDATAAGAGTGLINFTTALASTGSGSLTLNAVTVTGSVALSMGAGNITFNQSANSSYGGVISGTGGLTKSGTGALTLTGANLYTGGTTVSQGTLSIGSGGTGGALSNTGELVNNSAVIFNRSNAYTYSGVISGSGTVTKSGAGTLSLTGASSYTGGTTVTAGTLSIGAGGATGSLSDTGSLVNNSAVIFNRSNAYIYAGAISGTGTVRKSGAGVLTLSGANSYSGGTILTAGTLSLGSLDALGSTGTLSFGGGILQYTAANTTDYSSRFSSAINQVFKVDTNGQSVTFASVLGSTGGTLTKSGSGSLTLTGANSYSGATTISAGVLKAAHATALGATAAGTTVASGAALELEGGIAVGAEALSLNGTGVLSGGALRNVSGNNSYAGTITLAGTTSINSDSGTLTLDVVAGSSITGTNRSLTIGGAGNITVVDPIATGTGGLTKSGAGTLILSGANSYTGATSVSGGTLKAGVASVAGMSGAFGNNSAVMLSNTAGVVLDISGYNTQIGSITGGGTTGGNVTLGAETLTIGGNNSTPAVYSGVVSGTGAVIKIGTGTLTLGGANLYTGGTTVTAGTLSIGAGGTTGSLSDTGILANNSALIFNRSNAIAYGGVISGSGTLRKAGTGVLTLSGANSYSGATSVSGGTLKAGVASVANTSGAFGNNSAVMLSNTAGVVLDISGYSTQIGSITGGGTTGGNVTLGGETLTIGGNNITPAAYSGVVSGTGGLIKIGTGTLTLGGANSYSGQTMISGGTLSLNAAGTIALSSGVSNEGLFSISGAKTIDSMTGSGSTALGANILTIGDASGSSSTYSGVISGTGGITKAGAGTLTLSGANLYTGLTTVTAGKLAYGITNALSTGAVTVNGSGAILDIGSFSDTIGAVTLTNGSITGTAGVLTGSSYVINNVSGTASISAILAGSGTLTKSGAGTLILSGANSYSGATSITAGVLRISHATALGTIAGVTTVASGAALELDGGIVVAAEALSLNGTGILSGGALRNVSGNNSYAGAITLAGTTSINSDSGTLTLDVATGNSITGTNRSLTSGGAGNIIVADPIATGTGAVTKTGSGTVTLSGLNTYTGVTTINAGILSVGTIGNGGTAGNLGKASSAATNLVLGGGTLQYTGADASTNRAYTLTAGTTSFVDVTAGNLTISGAGANTTGSLSKLGSGTLTLSGANLYTGVTAVRGGTLAYGINNALSTGGVTVNGGTLTLGTFSDTVGAVTLTEGSITGTSGVLSGSSYLINNVTGTTTLSATLAGSAVLTKTGAGTLTLSGSNSYGGGTVLNAGILTLGSSGAVGSTGAISFSGGTLQYSAANTTDYSSRFSTASNQAFTIDTNSRNVTLASILSSIEGSFTKSGAGTLTLSGANTYTGLTTVSGGTLKLGSAGSATSTPLGTIDSGTVVSSGATLDMNGYTPGSIESLTINGTGVSNGGALLNSGGAATWNGSITMGSESTIFSDSGFIAGGQVTGTAGRLTLGGGGDKTFENTLNDFSTVAVTNAGALSLIDANELTLSSISSTGTVDIATLAGNLTISGNLSTTNGSVNAIKLNAGKNSAAGTSTGGDILITGSPVITTGNGGSTTFYTGSISGSTGLSAFIGTGSGRFRYDSDESSTGYTTGLSAGRNAIYREQPTVTVRADNKSKTYGSAPSLNYTVSGKLNDDSDIQLLSGVSIAVGGTTSSSGNYIAGEHTLTPSSASSLLGYSLAYSSGTLTVTPYTLTVSGLGASNKVYDATTTAALIGTATVTPLGSDDVTVGGPAAGVFAGKSVGTGKMVTVTGNTISGKDGGNYTLVQQSGLSADITVKLLTITGFLADDKTYDGTTTAVITTPGILTGIVGGDRVSFLYSGASFNSKDVATNNTVSLNGVTLGGSGDEANYSYSGPTTDDAVITSSPEQVVDGPVIRYTKPVFSNVTSIISTAVPKSMVSVADNYSSSLASLLLVTGLSNSATGDLTLASTGSKRIAPVGLTLDNMSEMNSGGDSVNSETKSQESVDSDITLAAFSVNDLSPGRERDVKFDRQINVFLGGKLVRQSSSADIRLPEAIRLALAKRVGGERVSLLNGSPLPSWLRYDARSRAFKVISTPGGSFHVKVRVQNSSRSWVVDIASLKSTT